MKFLQKQNDDGAFASNQNRANANNALKNAMNFRNNLRAHERDMLQYWTVRVIHLRKRAHLMNQ